MEEKLLRKQPTDEHMRRVGVDPEIVKARQAIIAATEKAIQEAKATIEDTELLLARISDIRAGHLQRMASTPHTPYKP